MTERVKKTVLSAFLLCQLFFLVPAFGAEVLERILAVVNDEIITEQDLDVVMAPVLAQFRTTYTGPAFAEKAKLARQELLDKLIEERLVLSEAKKKKVIVKDPEVDDMMTEVRNKFPNREVYLKAIGDQGLTEKKLWNRFHDQLMTQKLVGYEVKSRVTVSPGEVSEYYKTHPEQFSQGDRVRLQHILVRVGSRTDEEAHAFADSLYAQIQAGKPFEDIAKSYSEGAEAKDGGEMGWLEKGQLLGDIDDQVFAVEPGQVTHPVKSSLGYHIFKVAERQKFSVKPLTEVRDDIQETIFKEKTKSRLQAWLQNLKKNAYISLR